MVGSLRPHRRLLWWRRRFEDGQEEAGPRVRLRKGLNRYNRDGGGYDHNLMHPPPESFCRSGRDQSFPKGCNRRGARCGAKGTHQIVYYNTSRGKCYGVVTFWNPWSAVKATNDQNGRIVYYNTSRGNAMALLLSGIHARQLKLPMTRMAGMS